MSFWENLGAAVGIGACRLTVTLDAEAAGWNETLSGRVQLEGGKVSQQLNTLDAELVEHWTTTTMAGKVPITNHHYRVHDTVRLAAGLTVPAGNEPQTFSFTLTAPWGGPLAHHWLVRVLAGIPGAVDQCAVKDFKLLPARVFRDTAGILSELSRLSVRKWHNHETGVRADLPAEGEANAVLDGIRLDIALDGPVLRGRVEVNPQEHSLGDVMRSLIGADWVRTPFEIPAEDPNAARRLFEEVLRPHLDALRHLPLPATAPAPAPGQLPLPSEPEGEG